MSTRKSRLAFLLVRIKKFRIPFIMLFPLRCLDEVLDGATDILCLFERINKRAAEGIEMTEAALGIIRSAGPLDLVDVDIKSPETRVKVKALLR